MAAAKTDWSTVLDVPRAVATAQSEMYGDWLRDPWAWPELRYLANHPHLVADRLTSGQVRFERLLVPKINYGTRPASVQDPADRVAYHALVNSLSVRTAGNLAGFVYGWRLDRAQPEPGRFIKNKDEWFKFVIDRREAATEHDSLLVSDVTGCFASVPTERLVEMLQQRVGRNLPVQALETILSAYNGLPDRSGIPQRSTASSLLANAYLAPIDDRLHQYCARHGAVALRWMDDLWIFGGGFEALRVLQLHIEEDLRAIGLEMNLGKTAIFEGDEVRDHLDQVDLETAAPTQVAAPSGVHYQPNHSPEDLDRQFERFIERPHRTDKTVISYVCQRIYDYSRDDLIEPLIAVAPNAPQGADRISRLLARTGAWQDLGDWFIGQARGPLGMSSLPWPIAQLATMFPSSTPVPAVLGFFGEVLEHHHDLTPDLIGVAAHRISTWSEADARALLRTLGKESNSPLNRRVAAISLHNLGDDRRTIDQILSEFQENRATRQLLDEARGRPLPVAADFDLASVPDDEPPF
jgi:hypothetical protein